MSPRVCWPVLIQQQSSHRTDPLHCWHLRPAGTAVWICRGVLTYGSRKQKKKEEEEKPPRLNVCSGSLPLHPAPRRSAAHSWGYFCFCFDTFGTSSRVTRDDLCHGCLLNNIGLCGHYMAQRSFPPSDDVSIPFHSQFPSFQTSCFTLHSGHFDLHEEDSLSSQSFLMNAEVFHCVCLTAYCSHCVIVLWDFVSAALDLMAVMSLAPQGQMGEAAEVSLKIMLCHRAWPINLIFSLMFKDYVT